MRKYVICDFIENLKTGETMTFYLGKDGKVWHFPEYADGYNSYSWAFRRIIKEVNDTYFWHKKINDTEYLESNTWHHYLSIVDVNQ